MAKDVLAVLVNGNFQFEYQRNRPLDARHQSYLAKMDDVMNDGVILGGKVVDNPDPLQRAQYVASNLAGAISADNEPIIAAACAYLANRIPDLKQVKIAKSEGSISIELVFDQRFQNQVDVHFRA
ncbi:MAG: hypothetical protein WAN46_19720 [Gammaproteobacteria bacterium]